MLFVRMYMQAISEFEKYCRTYDIATFRLHCLFVHLFVLLLFVLIFMFVAFVLNVYPVQSNIVCCVCVNFN